MSICCDVQALEYLHSKDVIFRDLKLENILMHVEADSIKLTDFGLAKIVPYGATTTTICGTVQYMGASCAVLYCTV